MHEPNALPTVEQKEHKTSLFMLQGAEASKILSKLVENLLQVLASVFSVIMYERKNMYAHSKLNEPISKQIRELPD